MQDIKSETNNLFVILLKYLVPLEVIDKYRAEHLSFLDEYYKKNIFITSGPQVPRTGGMIIAQCSNKETLLQLLKDDPFNVHKLADYEIYEFSPTKYNAEFKKIGEHLAQKIICKN